MTGERSLAGLEPSFVIAAIQTTASLYYLPVGL